MPEAGLSLIHFVTVSVVLFGLGLYGALRRSNLVAILMSIELMMNAVNVNLVAFSRYVAADDPTRGQVFTIFVMTMAAAEVSVGLAILLAVARRQRTSDVNQVSTLRG